MGNTTEQRYGGLASPLAYRVLLDRYALKDLERRFVVGDPVVVVVKEDPKWPEKGTGRVKNVNHDDTITVVLDESGETITVPVEQADRPMEHTWSDVTRRVARAVASVESRLVRDVWQNRFHDEMANQRLIPAGRILAGAGVEGLSLFNCHVCPNPKDSRHGIIETLETMVEIMSRGGGVGFTVSSLRPFRAPVYGVNGRSSGAVSWMDLYSQATALVEQGGSRRGALMLQIDDWHPDLLRFIDAKRTPGMIENANISVRISDEFMAAVKADGEWTLRFPDTRDEHYDSEWDGNLPAWEAKGYPVVEHAGLRAREIWERLTESAWASAEPGIVFSGRHERESNSQLFNPLISTNPCIAKGETVLTDQGLLPIEDVRAGMKVRTHEGRFQEVVWAGLTRHDAAVVRVVVRTAVGTLALRCTAEHRLHLATGVFRPADACLGETVSTIEGIGEVVSIEPAGNSAVYDLTVEEDHTFIAGGITVHNCAEEPLPAWGVCTLGHVNLAACMADGELNRSLVEQAVRVAVRFLDNVIDTTPYFIEEIRNNQKMERRIGLGTMGLAEVLMRMSLTYGSPEAVSFVDSLYRDIAHWAYDESVLLASEKGAFPAWNPAILETEAFVAKMAREFPDLGSGLRRHGMRNVTVLTQAPTGTIGALIDTSTGIEPYYDIRYERQSRVGTDTQYARPAQEWLDAHPGKKLPTYFIGAKELTPVQHVVMQATVQKWVDASISKTANAPADYSVEDTRRLYEVAYELGCKGVTIYRDQSRSDQVLRSPAPEAPATAPPQAAGPLLAPRPARMRGECFLVRTHFGNLTLDVHEDPATGEPIEIIASAGAAGSDLMADAVALGMAASVLLRLRSDVPPLQRVEVIADKFRNIGGGRNGAAGLGAAASLAQGIARGLDLYLEAVGRRFSHAEPPVVATETTAPAATDEAHGAEHKQASDVDLCPACGRYSMEMAEGCRTCRECGFSKCS